MAAPTSQDVERLLAPISSESPAGVSLRYDGTYDKIRNARREDDPSLPPGEWERPPKLSDYPGAAACCFESLERRTKDFQIAAWLADAWSHLHGLAGMLRGVELLTKLSEKFWDTAFPLQQEDGDEARTQIFEWVDDALSSRLRAINLGDEGSSSSLTIGELANREMRRDSRSSATREGVLARASLVSPTTLRRIHAETQATLSAVKQCALVISAHLPDSGGLRRLGGELLALGLLVEETLRGMPSSESDPTCPEQSQTNATQQSAPAGGRVSATEYQTIASRADAYRRLNDAADYLLRTEPHSPVPYLVKRAISWGNLSLAELLHEFIPDSDDLVAAHRLLGMRQREE